MNIIRILTLADIITLSNAVCGVLSIVFAIERSFTTAMLFLILAVILDGLDGIVARTTKRGPLGADLDSLADTISFGVAPVAFGYMQTQTFLAVIAFIFFVACGILRLARFNLKESHKYYEGMPITMNGILIPIVYFVDLPTRFYPIIYIVLGILMISSFKTKKLF